jgi:hypothetical protein
VDQSVPKGNDAAGVAHLVGQARLQSNRLVQWFPDDLKLPLHGEAKHGISNVVGQRLSGRKPSE